MVEDCFFRGRHRAGGRRARHHRADQASASASCPRGAGMRRSPRWRSATLAGTVPGRVDVGIGHGMPGWMRQVGAWPAEPADDARRAPGRGAGGAARLPGERRRSVRDLDGVELNTPPSSVPRILAGVRGSRSLALAGRSADGTILAEPVTPEYVAEALRHIAPTREHRIVAYCVAVVDDDATAARDAPARAGVDRRPGLGRAHRAAAVRRRVPGAAGRRGYREDVRRGDA